MEHLGDKFDERWLKGIVFGELQRHLEDPILKLSTFLGERFNPYLSGHGKK
jgi:hypothetical protein